MSRVNVEVFSSSERPAEVDLNQNKTCLDTVINEEVKKMQPFFKKGKIL